MSVYPGIPDYSEKYSAICHPFANITVKCKVLQYESNSCLLVHYSYTGKQRGSSHDRRYNMCTECRALDRHLQQDASTAAKVSEIVATVEENPDLRTQLDEVLLEEDQHNESHGALLQEIWETDSADRELVNFKEDQQRNSEYTEVIQVLSTSY